MIRLVLFIVLFGIAISDAQGQFNKLSIKDDNATAREQEHFLYSPYKKLSGIIVDSLTQKPLAGALVSILSKKSPVRHASTDEKGAFNFSEVDREGLKIEITFTGYKIYAKYIENINPVFDLGTIPLQEDVQQIDEVVVKARLQFFTIKGDTIQYNPQAVRTLQEDMAVDILKKMPGVSIQGNSISIMGENVERTYVNGRLIYGKGAMIALQNVEANQVASVQSYKEVDALKFLSDGDTTKRRVVNVLTFSLFNENTTADLYVNAGADMKKGMDNSLQKRYNIGGRSAFYSEPLQTEVRVSTNNLNQNIIGGMGGYNRTTRASLSYSRQTDEEDRTFTVGDKTVTQRVRKGSYEVNYDYNDQYSKNNTISQRIYFPTTEYRSREYADTSQRSGTVRNHKISGSFSRFYWWNLNIYPTITFSENRNNSSRRNTSSLNGQTVSRSDQTEYQKGTDYSLYLDASVSIPYIKKRKLSLSGAIRYENNDGNGWQADTLPTSSQKTYLSTLAPGDNTSVIAYLSEFFSFGEKASLSTQYGLNYTDQKKKYVVVDEFTGLVDTTSTYNYTNNQSIHNLSIRFAHNVTKKFNYTLEFIPTVTLVGRDEYFPQATTYTKNYFQPNMGIQLSYRDGYAKELSFTYNTSSSTPSVEQLRNQLNYTNPLMLQVGNPGLKQSKSHFLSFFFQKMNMEKQHTFSLRLTANFIQNQSGMRQIFFTADTYLPQYDYTALQGATLSDYVNINGGADLRLSADYTSPVSFLGSTFRVNGAMSYMKSPSYIGDKRIVTQDYVPQLAFNLTSNFSSKFEGMIDSNTGYRNSRNNDDNKNNQINQRVSLSFRYNPHKKIFINSSYEFYYLHDWQPGTTDITNNIWNATIGYRLFRNNTGNLSVSVYDILNRNTSFVSSMQSNYISNSWNQLFSRYFTVNFSIKLNKKK